MTEKRLDVGISKCSDLFGTLVNSKLTRLLRIAALAVALGALVFLFIAIIIAMHYGDGKILVDFNSRKEGWLELILTAFALSVVLIHTLEYISPR